MKNTVAIIGSHPRTRGEFDFTRSDADIWVFNEALSGKTFPRADAVFQMHEEAIWRNPANRNDSGHVDWLKTVHDTKVYMQDTYADIPASVRFPLEDIIERFKIGYFTSSVGYALALACFLGYKRIELYGVEMETNTEYAYQRDGVTLWVGVALGLGIEVDLHIGMLKDQPLYGYEGEVVIDYHRFDERIAELKPEVERLGGQYQEMVKRVLAALSVYSENSGETNEKNLLAAVDALKRLGDELGFVDGRIQENIKYKGKADKMREASGEFLFSRQEFESAAKNLTDKANEEHVAFVSHGTLLGTHHDAVKKTPRGSKKREKVILAYRTSLRDYLNANNKTAIYKGAVAENFMYMAYLDKHIRAAGGAKSEAALLESMRNNDRLVEA